MGQIFIANELDSILQVWEEMNLIGDLEFYFHINLKQRASILPPKPKGSEDLEPLVGSEINMLGMFARAIPEYTMLRKVLSGKTYSHPTNFLPRIPKEFRKTFATHEDFIWHLLVKSVARLPIYLQKWNETKRACIVEDSIPIPSIDLREENWLSHLPYHAFYLKINSPFVLSDGEYEWTIKNFIIYDDGPYVRVFFWADENVNHLLGSERAKDVQKAIDELRKQKFTNLSKKYADISNIQENILAADFCIEKNGTGFVDVKGLKSEKVTVDLYDTKEIDFSDPLEEVAYEKIRKIMEMINGFCKLFSAIPPRNSTVSIDRERAHDNLNQPLQWLELPIQNVNYLHTDIENNEVVIRHGSGNEKSPHYRRGHYRRYLQSDGTEKRIWIGEILVREDILAEQLLRGGAIKLKA